jgi:DNA-binding MarR family transcriptional regulator
MDRTELVQAMARFGTAYTRFLRASMPSGQSASYPRLRVLSALADEAPQRIGELARTVGATSHNVTKLLDALEVEGLVARAADPADARARLVTLTDAGRRACQTLEPHHASAVSAAFDSLTQSELAELARLIGKVTQRLSGLEHERRAAADTG